MAVWTLNSVSMARISPVLDADSLRTILDSSEHPIFKMQAKDVANVPTAVESLNHMYEANRILLMTTPLHVGWRSGDVRTLDCLHQMRPFFEGMHLGGACCVATTPTLMLNEMVDARAKTPFSDPRWLTDACAGRRPLTGDAGSFWNKWWTDVHTNTDVPSASTCGTCGGLFFHEDLDKPLAEGLKGPLPRACGCKHHKTRTDSTILWHTRKASSHGHATAESVCLTYCEMLSTVEPNVTNTLHRQCPSSIHNMRQLIAAAKNTLPVYST